MKRISLIFLLSLVFTSHILSQNNFTFNKLLKKDSYKFQTKNEQFRFEIGGRMFVDAAIYFDDETELKNGGEIRDVRLCLDADYRTKWNARINVDFSELEIDLKDVFIKYKINENSFVRAGYFFEPFGVEQTESTNDTKFMHVSSSVETFRPGRNVGVEYNRWSEYYYLGVGIFGSKINFKEENKNYYNYYSHSRKKNKTELSFEDGYAFSTRMVIVPVKTDVNILHLGLSGNYRILENLSRRDRLARYYSKAGSHIEKINFLDVELNHVKSEMKYAFELLGAIRNVSFQSEFLKTKVNRESGYKNYSAKGWYTQVAMLINGGKYSYKSRSARLNRPKTGAIEILARYNETNLNDRGVYAMGGMQKDYTLGCNWYARANIILKLNASNVEVDQFALNGEENFNMIQTRLQFLF